MAGGVLLLVVIAVVVGALGGWARTTPDDVRVVEPGVEVEATPLRVRLDRAEATYEVSGRLAEPGRAYVVVEGTLALDHHESVDEGIVADAFATDLRSTDDGVGDLSDDAEPSIQVAEDGSSLRGLGPGLTYGVLLVYDIDESAVPSTLTVSLLEHLRRSSSFDSSEVGWFDPSPLAHVTLDLVPLPDERPAPDPL